MAYFSIPLEMAATVYIQANTLGGARAKLQDVLSKSIDARDKRWFSNAPYGVLFFPEFSFATAMSLFKPTSEQTCTAIERSEVEDLMLSRKASKKSSVLPRSRDWFGEGKLPIYTVDLTVRTTGIVKAASHDLATAFVADMNDTGIHWEVADKWFEVQGLEGDFPLILSPNLLITGIGEGCELQVRWPEYRRDVAAAASINAEIENLADGFKALEIGGLANRLRSYFQRSGMSFSLLDEDDVLQIAGGLIDYKMAKPTGSSSSPNLSSNRPAPTRH